MHTQHVKFSTYVAWGGGVVLAVAVGVVFEEGKVSAMEEADDDVDGSVLEVVVVVVLGLPSPSLLLVSFSVVLLDCIGTTEQRGLTCSASARFCIASRIWGTSMFHYEDTSFQ